MTSSMLPEKLTEGWPDWSILIVDDEAGMRNFLLKTLAPRSHFVMAAGSAEEGQEWLNAHHADLVILDISLPGQDGVSWLKTLRNHGFGGEVILITAFADLDTAIEALRAGASDFILKPFRVPQILNAVRKCVERVALRRENYVLRRGLQPRSGTACALVGSSTDMAALRDAIARIAQVDSTVLLQGESGTGKELVARELHARSNRHTGPFVPLNCAAVSPDLIEAELFGHALGWNASGRNPAPQRNGLFYYAQGGTLFLDEVAELPLAVQATLLRTMEDLNIRPLGGVQQVPVNVRLIAATNRRLEEEVAAGRFRADLYYRLKVVDLHLPPLRQHKQDLTELFDHFVRELTPALGLPGLALTPEERDFLTQYDWPGNCRELRNLVERSLILGGLNVSALYPSITRSASHTTTDLATLEKQHIQSVLASVQGDKTQAAKLLGVSRRTLERRVAEWSQG